MRLSYTLFLLLALGAAGAAGTQQPRRITFNDAIAIALEQNLAVKQAKNATALTAATVQQQKMQLLPDLRLNVNGADNVGRNFSQTEGAIIDQQTQSMNTSLSSSMTLFDGMKTLSTIRAAKATDAASASDLARARQTAVFTVASNYVALANAQEQLRVQQENLKSLQSQQDQIQKFVDAGVRPMADLYQAEASVASAGAAVVQANRTVEMAKVDLVQTLQLDPAGDYDFVTPTVNAATAMRSVDLDSLIAQAYAQRPDLQAESKRVEAAGQDVNAARAGRLPSLSLTGDYNTAYNSAANLGLNDQLEQHRGGTVAIGVSIPIFDRGAVSLTEQKARIEQDNARLSLQAQRQQVAVDVRRAYLDAQSAEQQLAAASAQLAAAQKAVDATQARYEVGAATLVELTVARAQAVQAASAVATAKYNLVLQQTVMDYYTGALDPQHVSLGS
jgi:outer membrane protein